jgi:hypothetical protein
MTDLPIPAETGDVAFGAPPIEFDRSADGLLLARIEDLVFAMVPGREEYFLASAWRVRRPLDQLRRDDFYSHHGRIEDEAAFRARMTEQAHHSRELKALSRRAMRISCNTPWGASQGATVYADGIVSHTTASHGGFHLSAERNAEVHPLLRSEGGWYEEDCAWAIVAVTFPALFTSFERRCAEKTLKDWWPDAWETIFGTILGPGESHQKDRHAFETAHADDWVVISAIRSAHHAGMVEAIATRGGRRGHRAEERRFLVPDIEYDVGRFGFVIDLTRHEPCDGSSSFVGVSSAGRVA